MRAILFGCAALVSCAGAWGQTTEDELALVYGDKLYTTIATGSKQLLSKAPAAATVITADDIRAMGATDLDQVLETVPGLHVSRSPLNDTPIYAIRGIQTALNQQVLMMINGQVITFLFQGNRSLAWGGLALHNVARIEIIRGSGSALYGADAFSGVINIVTKSADQIDGTEFGVGAGSFRTGETWLLHGGKWNDWDVVAYLRLGKTNGSGGLIEADAQTSLDQAFGTHASHAPGPIDNRYRAVDASIDLSGKHLRWRANLARRFDLGSGAGIAYALDPTGTSFSGRTTSDLNYHRADWVRDWDLTMSASYFHMEESSYLYVFPVGAFGGTFPDGFIGAPKKFERHLGVSAAGTYTGWDGHRIRVGAGIENFSMYRTEERKNFALTFVEGVGNVPRALSSVRDSPDSTIYLHPQLRRLRYGYVQDEWHFARDWTLTGGVRHDRFSDFGATTNPRLALVWDARYDLTARLLWGSAFRAPSFAEQYSTGPSTHGNPSVRPEKIATLETGVNWVVGAHAQLGLNLFRYRIEDLLRFVPNADPITGATAANAGRQHGHGLTATGASAARSRCRVITLGRVRPMRLPGALLASRRRAMGSHAWRGICRHHGRSTPD